MGESSYDFAGETAIVTGGSSGIGRAVARRFGAAGATVLVADVREEPKGGGAPSAEAIRDAGGEAAFVETDVSDPEAVAAVVEAAREFGGVDVMVNNAGAFTGDRLLDADTDDLDALYEVNVRGVYAGCQAAARDMLDRGEPGCIVNTASISSTLAQVGQTAYDATKGAVRMVTRGAALELASEGVRVNAVAPGGVDTEIVPEAERGRERAGPDKPIPMGYVADPEAVAGAYLFLASDDARYVTGHLLRVDGGYAVL
ncbi:MAG: SDR family NAD(P)-dependent oxidoreductase [Halobacteriaceae archaeon]